ncbi:uncharacterized protein C3orf20-like isoform X2 [Pungitius pungitius]|uniref:uncharacterized protein C3orf20-like isoform X2 n=1 Tax=Pungitius pungitius TaxID=134920 RepID=UPI002E0FBE83
MERISDAPLKTRARRDVHSAALPSLNPPKRADAKTVRPEEDRSELRELAGHRSLPAEKPPDSYVKLPRTPKRQPKEEPHVTRIGPLQIHGNINPASVIIPNEGADLQAFAVIRCPAVPPSLTPSTSTAACPALLRAALLGEAGRRRCCCSATLMPVVTDLEYDAFVLGQPPHTQQILVVCATPPPPLRPGNSCGVSEWDALEQLYGRMNKHRTMPCSQCQMDSFRLVRYEMSTGKPSCGGENLLLQQRHNAAPGMVLMYMRGTLLFMGHIFSDYSCSARDLQKQISRSRGDYRLGLSFSSDCKYSDAVKTPAAADPHNSQDSTFKGGSDTTSIKVTERKTTQLPGL